MMKFPVSTAKRGRVVKTPPRRLQKRKAEKRRKQNEREKYKINTRQK